MGDLGEVIDEATSSFNESKKSVLESFINLEEEFRSKLEALTGDFAAVTEEGNDKLSTLQDTLDITSDDAITVMREKFMEAVNELYNSTEGLIESCSTLAKAGEESNKLLDEKLAEVVDGIVGVFDEVDKVDPALNEVTSILG